MKKEETGEERERERERRDVEMANFERVKREIWDKRNYVRKRGKLGGGGEGASKKSRKYVSCDENEELKKLEIVSMRVQRKSKDVRTKAVSVRRER